MGFPGPTCSVRGFSNIKGRRVNKSLSASPKIGLSKSEQKVLNLQSNEKRKIQRKRNGQDGQTS